MVALHFSMLHRFAIFFCPGTIAHGSIRLPFAFSQIGHDKTFPALVVGSRDTRCTFLWLLAYNSKEFMYFCAEKYSPSLFFTSGPKCLSEVNFFSMDSVPSLLGSEKRGLGNWRGIGSKYGMKDHELDDLANMAPSERGRGVLEFLKTSQPSLTVYDFCRTLKEETFKRFDIVKKLENHFLVESYRHQGN